MNGYRSLVIGLYVLGAFLVNKASADFIDFLHYDNGKQIVRNTAQKTAPAPQLTLASNNHLDLHIVKIGSHVLRNQLLDAGCVEAHQVGFIKCEQIVLDRVLSDYRPIR